MLDLNIVMPAGLCNCGQANARWKKLMKQVYLVSILIELWNKHSVKLCFFEGIHRVSGYISRTVARRKWCESCAAVLYAKSSGTSDNLLTVASNLSDSLPQIFNMANCGGLVRPTEQLFLLVCTGYLYFGVLEKSDMFKAHVGKEMLL